MSHQQGTLKNEFDLDWQMSNTARYCLIQTLREIRPEIAIEIGTANGGSLQVISKYAKKVYSVDISSNARDKLASRFDNVEFLVGDSKAIIPDLIAKIQASDGALEFALIDGEHSRKGVQSDIENLLRYTPTSDLTILMHDSFNPECRKGMLAPDYSAHDHVHAVEIDFVIGGMVENNNKREMWGGFGLIKLSPHKRLTPLTVSQRQQELYQVAYLGSIHRILKAPRIFRPLIKWLYRWNG